MHLFASWNDGVSEYLEHKLFRESSEDKNRCQIRTEDDVLVFAGFNGVVRDLSELLRRSGDVDCFHRCQDRAACCEV